MANASCEAVLFTPLIGATSVSVAVTASYVVTGWSDIFRNCSVSASVVNAYSPFPGRTVSVVGVYTESSISSVSTMLTSPSMTYREGEGSVKSVTATADSAFRWISPKGEVNTSPFPFELIRYPLSWIPAETSARVPSGA